MNRLQLGSTSTRCMHNVRRAFVWVEKGKIFQKRSDMIDSLKVLAILYSLKTHIECLLHARPC